ncbi:unnamed protein product [Pleuronectes platessa]|uniref:Uncharacterized protein n=1 Tax=Pleuronectes platessa TaxID=8262 RepID=A0A9N7TWQ3_PLEPL|nr:unnamed protein product [Pleuronectes platessa]
MSRTGEGRMLKDEIDEAGSKRRRGHDSAAPVLLPSPRGPRGGDIDRLCPQTVHSCSSSFQPLSDKPGFSTCLFKTPDKAETVLIGQQLPVRLGNGTKQTNQETNGPDLSHAGNW